VKCSDCSEFKPETRFLELSKLKVQIEYLKSPSQSVSSLKVKLTLRSTAFSSVSGQLGTEPQASCLLSTHSTTGTPPKPATALKDPLSLNEEEGQKVFNGNAIDALTCQLLFVRELCMEQEHSQHVSRARHMRTCVFISDD
jgi:hypothetical protein